METKMASDEGWNPENFHNYLRLSVLVNGHGSEALRQIFLARYQKITRQKWQDGTDFAKEFLQSLCKGIYKPTLPLQKKMVEEAELNKFDLMMLSRFIQSMDLKAYSSTERQDLLKQNTSVNELNILRNKFAHLPSKTLDSREFEELWEQGKNLLESLEVSTFDISELKNAVHLDGIELKSGVNAEEQMLKAHKIREAGNLAMQEGEYDRAIKFYSQALVINGLSNEELGLLHSNRSHAYLKSVMEETQSEDSVAEIQKLALADAEAAMELRPTWWKGYFRGGRVHQFKREWLPAIDLFDRALALNPSLVEVQKCRDECRYDQGRVEIQEHINCNAMPWGLKNELSKLKRERGINLDADIMVKKYEKLMKSRDPEDQGMAYLFFGDRYVQGVDIPQDFKKGAEFFQKAVDAGVPAAMGALGTLYMEGKGVQRNIEKAVSLFERAAECKPKKDNGLGIFSGSVNYGVTHGQFQIGKCYQEGTGKPLDYYQASVWYKRASEGGHAGAANNLGILYHSGRGVKKCSVRAKQFWNLAASRGNELAMDSLAWQYLSEKDLEQAENWYQRALDAGNVNSILHKDNFYAALKQAKKDMKDLLADFSPGLSSAGKNLEEVISEIKSGLPSELEKLMEACERIGKHQPKMAEFAYTMESSPLLKYWTHLTEITKRAKNGHPYAQKLLLSMSYFAEGQDYLKTLRLQGTKANSQYLEKQCILKLADCFRATEIVACFEPADIQILTKICKAKMTVEKTDLDLAARVVQSCLLSYSQSSELLSFLNISVQKYPDEEFLYKILSGAHAVNQNYKASLQASQEGLKRFPKSSSLLYCKAGAMKMIERNPAGKVIAAYQEFIQDAPFDDRMIPEAYYNMAFYSLGEGKKGLDAKAKTYYSKGMEKERELLPCFIPIESQTKCILEALLSIDPKKEKVYEKAMKNVGNKGQSSGSPKPAPAAKSASMKLQLSNPTRLQFVRRHRETLKMMSELYSSNQSKPKYKANLTVTPQNDQQVPSDLMNIKEITFRDMNPRKDHVYRKRVINLLISEDPMFGMYTAIHVVVRDDNGDCLNCSFYELDHFDPTVREKLCFGSTISILNPYFRLAADGTLTLRVDDPNSIIYNSSGKEKPVCRYCWTENPPNKCAQCKRAKYCNRDCQTADWKDLKHKLICNLKCFEDM